MFIVSTKASHCDKLLWLHYATRSGMQMTTKYRATTNVGRLGRQSLTNSEMMSNINPKLHQKEEISFMSLTNVPRVVKVIIVDELFFIKRLQRFLFLFLLVLPFPTDTTDNYDDQNHWRREKKEHKLDVILLFGRLNILDIIPNKTMTIKHNILFSIATGFL